MPAIIKMLPRSIEIAADDNHMIENLKSSFIEFSVDYVGSIRHTRKDYDLQPT